MKGHSFIRENAPRVLSTEEKSLEGFDFSRYLYFLFAPTLIYRDEYPRYINNFWLFKEPKLLKVKTRTNLPEYSPKG